MSQTYTTKYPKHFSTLIDDIHQLFKQPHSPKKENVKLLTQAITDAVVTALEEDPNDFSRQQYLRMSSIGKPNRQIWYQLKLEHNNQTRKPMSPENLFKFLNGHIIEAVVLFLTREAGHVVEGEQTELELEGVLGHIDAIIDGVLVDVKSASRYAFPKFADGTLKDKDDFGYIGQLSGYAKALGKNHGAFLAVNKDTGEMAITEVPPEDMIDPVHKIKTLKEELKKDTPPERCYDDVLEKNGNKVLAKGCHYCAFKELCWNDSNNGQGLRAFKYANGPKFFTHVRSQPKVEEITDKYFGYTNLEVPEEEDV